MEATLSKANPVVKKIIQATFPEYRGRTIKFESRDKYYFENYWDGGTRYYVKAISIMDGKILTPDSKTTNPFNSEAHQTIDIPDNIIMVEHCIFCGKDLGIRLYANNNMMPKQLAL